MSLPRVNITISNGGLGSVAAGDYGIFGMIISGIAVVDKLALLEPKQIFTLEEAENLGLNAAYDETNSLHVYRQIKEFYDEAGLGTELWVMLVSQTLTMTDMVNKANANYAVKLLDAAQRKIRMLFVSRVPDNTYAPAITEGVDPDVYSALTNAQALAEERAGNNDPVRVVIEGRAFDGTSGDLQDLKTHDQNRAAVIIGGSLNDLSCSIGLLAGRLAADPIRRNPARVKTGSLVLLNGYIGAASVEASESLAGALHDKGFITFRTIPGKSGYFFTDAPTAVANSDDYATLPPGRVIDAAHVIAYATFMNEVLDEIEVDDNGYIDPVIVTGWQANIETAVLGAIGDQMSKFEAEINPRQNVLAVPNIAVKLKVTPVGYARSFDIDLGFDNPFN